MEHGTRIKGEDQVEDILGKLGEGNPGAIGVMIAILKRGAAIDPDALLGPVSAVLLLDAYGIYGSRIWLLYKDVCRQDLVRTIALLRAVQLGLLPLPDLQAALDKPRLLPPDQIDALVAQVRERLPRFGASDG